MRSAQELREAREAAGLTIAECCRISGTSRSTWQSWETAKGMINGRRPPAIAFSWVEAQAKLKEFEQLSYLFQSYVDFRVELVKEMRAEDENHPGIQNMESSLKAYSRCYEELERVLVGLR